MNIWYVNSIYTSAATFGHTFTTNSIIRIFCLKQFFLNANEYWLEVRDLHVLLNFANQIEFLFFKKKKMKSFPSLTGDLWLKILLIMRKASLSATGVSKTYFRLDSFVWNMAIAIFVKKCLIQFLTKFSNPQKSCYPANDWVWRVSQNLETWTNTDIIRPTPPNFNYLKQINEIKQ